MLLTRYGGGNGVRDRGLLESVLHRPKTGYYNSLAEQAAALMHSLTNNHAFVDGNKRVAFAATGVFLRLNGYRIQVSADEGERFLIEEVIKGGVPLPVITTWLASHMVPG